MVRKASLFKKRGGSITNWLQTGSPNNSQFADEKMEEENSLESRKRVAEGSEEDVAQDAEIWLGRETKEPDPMVGGSSELPFLDQVNPPLQFSLHAADGPVVDEAQHDCPWASPWILHVADVTFEIHPVLSAAGELIFAKNEITESEWSQLADSVEGHLTTATDFHIRNATPAGPANLYWSLLQAKWLEEGEELGSVSTWADFRYGGTREEMAQMIEVLGDTTEMHACMKADADLILSRQEDAAVYGRTPKAWMHIEGIGKALIAWFSEEDGTAELCSLQKDERCGFKLKEILQSLKRTKIGFGNGRYYVIGGPSKFKDLTKASIVQQLRQWRQQYAALQLPHKKSCVRSMRELEQISSEEEKAATHVLISNIPMKFKTFPANWLMDMQSAIQMGNEPHFRLHIPKSNLEEGMANIVETVEQGMTFSIIVRLAEVVETGASTIPVHFEFRGPMRKPMWKETYSKQPKQVATKYLMHLLTEHEARGLIGARIQCILRGCSWDASVNNFLRHLATRYMAVEKRLADRVAVVRCIRHSIWDGKLGPPVWKSEMVIIVYALSRVSQRAVDTAVETLGLAGHVNVEVKYGGYVFEMARQMATVKGRQQCGFLNKESLHITFSGLWHHVSAESVAGHVIDLLGVERVKYWIVRPVFRKKHRTVVVGLSGAEDPILDRAVATRLVDTSKPQWYKMRVNITCREFVGFDPEYIEIDTGKVKEANRQAEQFSRNKRSYKDAAKTTDANTEDTQEGHSSMSSSMRDGMRYTTEASSDQMVSVQKQFSMMASRLTAIEDGNASRDRVQQEQLLQLNNRCGHTEVMTKNVEKNMDEIRNMFFRLMADREVPHRGNVTGDAEANQDARMRTGNE
jgi:hypothetical protein